MTLAKEGPHGTCVLAVERREEKKCEDEKGPVAGKGNGGGAPDAGHDATLCPFFLQKVQDQLVLSTSLAG